MPTTFLYGDFKGDLVSPLRETKMCSPFSAEIWRKKIYRPTSYERIPSQRRRGSSLKISDDEEESIASIDSESFRIFSSPQGILSQTQVASHENLPLLQRTSRLRTGLGLGLTTLSGTFFAVASLFVKLSANSTIPAFEIIFFRLLVQILLVLPPAIWTRTDLLGERKRRPYLVWFGAVNFVAISSIYGAFTKLPLSDATICISATPIFTALFAYIFLKEPWHKLDALATFVCLGGIVLITRPTFLFGSSATDRHNTSEKDRLIGYLVALLGAVLQSMTFVMVRKSGGAVSFYTNVFYFGWVSALLSLIAMFAFQTPVIPDCGSARIFLLGVAVFGVLGSMCLNRGLQLENAAPVALMRNVDIIFAFLFDYAFFHGRPSLLTALGGLLVVLSTGAVAFTRWRSRRAGKQE